MKASYPPVSCICLTYGRPALLEEAIYSFLQQDYPGQKELVVLNDFAWQTLVLEHPEVSVFNVPLRFRTVGEKMNAAVALCSHDLLFVWDDDDIYLPRRLSFSVERLEPDRGFFKPGQAWWWNNGEISGPGWNVYHSGSCWSRELFDLVQGYASMGNGYDQEIEARFEGARPGSTRPYDPRPDEIAYIYRWGGTGSYHTSGFGHDQDTVDLEQRQVARFVEDGVRRGELPVGQIALSPCWRANYSALVANALAR